MNAKESVNSGYTFMHTSPLLSTYYITLFCALPCAWSAKILPLASISSPGNPLGQRSPAVPGQTPLLCPKLTEEGCEALISSQAQGNISVQRAGYRPQQISGGQASNWSPDRKLNCWPESKEWEPSLLTEQTNRLYERVYFYYGNLSPNPKLHKKRWEHRGRDLVCWEDEDQLRMHLNKEQTQTRIHTYLSCYLKYRGNGLEGRLMPKEQKEPVSEKLCQIDFEPKE